MRNNARWAALNALERCRRDGTWSSQALDSALLCMNLEDRDASLASRLFFGVLQNESYLDHYIDLYCRAKLEPRVRQILRIGAYQLLLLDKIPSHAAVSETVELCRDGKTGTICRRFRGREALHISQPGIATLFGLLKNLSGTTVIPLRKRSFSPTMASRLFVFKLTASAFSRKPISARWIVWRSLTRASRSFPVV